MKRNHSIARTISIVLIIFFLNLGQAQPVSGQAYDIQYDAAIAGMILQVKQSTLYNITAKLSGEKPVSISGVMYVIRTRHTHSGAPVRQATQFVYEYMKKLGRLDSVRFASWQMDGLSNRSVVGELKGTTRASEIILVTAHLDDVPSGSRAPGADDNASGSAALMHLATILSKYEFERTIRFVFFTGEEQGLLGSWVYARNVRNAGQNIVAVLNMDMLAWDSENGPTMRVHTRPPASGAGDLQIANAFVDVVDVYDISITPLITSYGMDASDHGSFWERNYSAVCIIEDDGDQYNWGDFNPNYHTTADTLSTLNMPYFTNIVRATLGTTAHLAYPVVP